jgi:hypothetical protein
MSAMSRLAEELTMNWVETEGGFEHRSGRVVIIREARQCGLYFVGGRNMALAKRGPLHTVVHHFLTSDNELEMSSNR